MKLKKFKYELYEIENILDWVIARKNYENLGQLNMIREYFSFIEKTGNEIESTIFAKLSENWEVFKKAQDEIEWREPFINRFIDEHRYKWKDWEIEKFKKEIEWQDNETLKKSIKIEITKRSKRIWDNFGYPIISFFDGLNFIANKEDLNNYFWHGECHAGSSNPNKLWEALIGQCDNINQLKVIESLTTNKEELPASKQSITYPAIALFCQLAKKYIFPDLKKIDNKPFCIMVCEKYNLKYTDNVRQEYGKPRHSDKTKKIVEDLIFPKLPKEDLEKIIESQKMYC